MKDERVLAHCNLFGVLGAIPYLLELDPAARELVNEKSLSLGFAIKDGPRATLRFANGAAEMTEGKLTSWATDWRIRLSMISIARRTSSFGYNARSRLHHRRAIDPVLS